MRARYLFAAITILGLAAPAVAEPAQPRTKDVVYGRRDGHALTMDVAVPRKPNGAGIILCISAEYRSTPEFRGWRRVPHPRASGGPGVGR